MDGVAVVYAFWAVRSGAELGGTAEALHEAKRRGCAKPGPSRSARRPCSDWTPVTAGDTLPTSFIMTWGRANRRACCTITNSPPN